MQLSLNPWVTSPVESIEEETPDVHVPPAAVISTPLKGMVEPDTADRLASRTMSGYRSPVGCRQPRRSGREPHSRPARRGTPHRALLARPAGRQQAPRVVGLPGRHARPHDSSKRPDAMGIRSRPRCGPDSASPSSRTHRERHPKHSATSRPSSAGERPASGPFPGSRHGGTETPPPHQRPAITNASSPT